MNTNEPPIPPPPPSAEYESPYGKNPGSFEQAKAPAITLMVVAIIGISLILLSPLFAEGYMGILEQIARDQGNQDLQEVLEEFRRNQASSQIFSIGMNLIALAAGVVIIYGANQMRKGRNWGISMAAAIIAMIPCVSPCCCLGLPVGIWAIIILIKEDVKQAFI